MMGVSFNGIKNNVYAHTHAINNKNSNNENEKLSNFPKILGVSNSRN